MANWRFYMVAFLFLSGCASSQNLDKIGKTESVIVEMDQLGQVYVVEPSGKLIKYSPQGDSLGMFFNKRWGRPTQVDILNPQKILVFYGETNQAVVLDRSLSSERVQSLEAMDQWQAKTIGWTRDQGLWIFSENDQTLVKTDPQGRVEIKSDPIYYFLSSNNFNPTRIIEGRSSVVLGDPKVGWVRFDLFGNYLDNYHLGYKWLTLDRSTDTIIYLEHETILSWAPGKAIPLRHKTDVQTRKQIMDWLSRKD